MRVYLVLDVDGKVAAEEATLKDAESWLRASADPGLYRIVRLLRTVDVDVETHTERQISVHWRPKREGKS